MRERPKEVFVPLSFDPGEAAQTDWGESIVYLFGTKVTVHVFCMRECYSADIFCAAFLRPNEQSVFEAHVLGFEHFGGVLYRVIFDNAKVAVKGGFDAHAVVRDRYLAFAAHYAFSPEFCNIAAGHEKGL